MALAPAPSADVIVVGGGLAGLCASIEAGGHKAVGQKLRYLFFVDDYHVLIAVLWTF